MTEQVRRFCDRYFETLNGTQSAIYAGFSEHTARVQASQMLATDEVEEYLTVLRNDLAEKTSVSQQKVLNEIAKIAFSDIRNFYQEDNNLKPIIDLDDNEAAALSSVKSFEERIPGTDIVAGYNKEIKLYDKLGGLEKLARILGMYKEDNEQARSKNEIDLSKLSDEAIKNILNASK